MFTHPKGAHLTERTKPLGAWLEQRIEFGTWPYSRSLETSPATDARLKSSNGTTVEGVNFGSQDYLGLASHDSIHAAAIRALAGFGPHSAASAIVQGNSDLSRSLEAALAEHLQTEHVLLFPTGWGAGFGTIVGLVRPNDHVVLDQNSHACLMQGARAATDKHTFFRHRDTEDARRTPAQTRARAR